MLKILFLCSQNKLRSPTAEVVFASYSGVLTASAGISSGAETYVSSEDIAWADIIMVMEHIHKKKLMAKHGKHIRDKRVVVLGIPDNFDYMDPELVLILKTKVDKLIRGLSKKSRTLPINLDTLQ